jgi:Sugar efflux transporter for intercellular exchange
MIMNWINTSFWMAYGFARMDPIIYVPNGIGLVLGVAQGILVCFFPRHRHSSIPVDDSNRGLVDQESDSDSDSHIIT